MVAHDAFTTSGDYYATPDPATVSHTPSGTPRGVFVAVCHVADFTDDVVSITYGGVTMTKIGFATPGDSGEDVGVSAYFLGSGLPTGTQTVSVDHDASGGRKRTYVYTVTASTDTVVNVSGVDTSTAGSAPSVTLNPSTSATRYAALACGRGVVGQVTPASNCTELNEADLGSLVISAVRNTTDTSSGSKTIGWTLSANDEYAMYAVAIEEVASADRAGEVSYAELELPDAPRAGEVSYAELQVPDAPRAGEVSYAELEIPTAPRAGEVSWAELELPDAPRAGQVSFAELEAPSAPRAGEVSYAELQVPDGPRAGEVSWAELEIPTAPRAGRISFAELETGNAPRAGEVAWAELEVPDTTRSGYVSFAELEAPSAPRSGQVSFAEFQAGNAPRAGEVSFAEFQIDNAPRAGEVSFAELQVGNAPRQGEVSYAELEVPSGTTRAGYVSYAELEVPIAPRAGEVSYAELEVPNAPGTNPGEGTYAEYSWVEAMVRRYVYDGGTDTDQEAAAIVAAVLGVTNTGEVLGNLRAAGATATSIPAAVDQLLSEDLLLEEGAALRRLAELWNG